MNYFSGDLEGKFPTLESAQKHIEHLSSLHLEQMDDSALEILADTYFSNFVYPEIHVRSGHCIFRAHISDNPIESIKRISIAPDNCVKEYGRANKPGEALFYGANKFDLSAFEVCQWYKHAIGRNQVAFVTVGVWRIREPLHLASVVFSPKVRMKRDDIKRAHERLRIQLQNKTLPERARAASSMLLEFFSDEFAKEKIRSHHDYKLSALYTRRLRTMNEMISDEHTHLKFDGIMYPGVSMKFKGDNIALFREAFECKVEQIPDKVFFAMCGNLNFERGTFTHGILHEHDRFEGDKIIWKQEIFRLPKD